MTVIQKEEALARPRFKTPEELGGPKAGETLCTLEDESTYLFTTGFVPWWEEYPGPHIPAPLQIGVAQDGDLEERAREDIVAYVNACPHFNISLNYREPKFLNGARDRFLCINHYAQFRIDDGYCDEGVCEGHWLTPVAIRVEDGRVLAG